MSNKPSINPTKIHDRKNLIESVARMAGTKSAKEIASDLGITYTTLKGIAQSHGISLKYSPVDDHDIYLIREVRRQYGLQLAEIAQKFDISTGFCSRVCAGIKKPPKAHMAMI